MKIKEVIMLLNRTVVLKGSDVSYWQGNIDFVRMYKAGIRFVIIRAGYGTTQDKNFVTYINAAIKAGLMVGIYWFMYAKSEAAARNNAKKCIEVIAPYKAYIHCMVWADWEYDSDANAGQMSSAKRSSLVRTFLTQLQVAEYQVGIYSNQDYIRSGKFTPSLIAEFPLWFAKYSTSMGIYAERGKDGHPYIWQQSSKGCGSAYGVSSKYLDLNRGYFEIKEVSTETVLDKVQTDNTVIKASDNPYPIPQRVIRYQQGKYLQYGDDVKWVQWHLWRFGLFVDENGIPDATLIDGYWGAKSDMALREAQRRLGLVVDGCLGPKTRNKFESV